MKKFFLSFIFAGFILLTVETTHGLPSSNDDPNLYDDDRISGLIVRELNKDLELKRQQILFEKLVAQLKANLIDKKLVSGE